MEMSTCTPGSLDAEIRVLRTPELAILILSHLDNRTLLLAQRVSRDFQSLIVNSPILQRKLFFRPWTATDDSNKIADDDAGSGSSSGGSSTHDKGGSGGEGGGGSAAARHVTYLDADGRPEREPRYLRRVHLNPLLVSLFPPLFPPLFPGTKSSHGSDRDAFSHLPWAVRSEDDDDDDVVDDAMPRRREPVLRDGASWRRMLLCNPQPEEATFTFSWSGNTYYGSDTVDMLRDHHAAASDGTTACCPLRMGPLYDLVQELALGKRASGSVDIDIGWEVADAWTKEEWLAEQADAKRDVLILEGEEFVLTMQVSHSYDGIQPYLAPLPNFKSRARDVVSFDRLVKLPEKTRIEVWDM